jgi:hypothetical protein
MSSVESHAVDATGSVAGNAVSNAGNRATDTAINKAASSAESKPQSSAPAPTAAPAGRVALESDDVLVKDGETYVVGKVLSNDGAGSFNVLVIADGRKLLTHDVLKVRTLSKTEAKLGADVYYSQDDNVRKGRWAKGSVTDTKKLGQNRLDVGAAADLDLGSQIVTVQ